MKGFWKAALVAGALLLPMTSQAQVFGQFTGAATTPVNGHLFGGYLHASEDLFGLVAQLRLSFYPNVDFGFQGGINRIQVGSGDRTTARLGSDVKFVVVKGGVVDISAGGALGLETGDNLSIFSIGPTAVASKSFQMGRGGAVIHYGGVALLFSNLDVNQNQDTDFSIPFRLGSEFQLSPEIKLIAEFQLRASDDINDDFSFVTGVNLPF